MTHQEYRKQLHAILKWTSVEPIEGAHPDSIDGQQHYVLTASDGIHEPDEWVCTYHVDGDVSKIGGMMILYPTRWSVKTIDLGPFKSDPINKALNRLRRDAIRARGLDYPSLPECSICRKTKAISFYDVSRNPFLDYPKQLHACEKCATVVEMLGVTERGRLQLKTYFVDRCWHCGRVTNGSPHVCPKTKDT